MSDRVAQRHPADKSRRFPEGNPIAAHKSPLSPVMQKVKGSLGTAKPAATLAFLTGEPLSICQKLLSGHRRPNAEMLEALFRTHLIVDAILGLTEGATDAKAKAVRKAVLRIRLEDELARLEAGEE